MGCRFAKESNYVDPIPIIVLGSHLVILVADNVPEFDIARGCRLDNAASSGLVEVQPVKKCVSDEQQARQHDTPNYVELLTCLQEARDTGAIEIIDIKRCGELPRQPWRRNHADSIAEMDLLVMPIISVGLHTAC